LPARRRIPIVQLVAIAAAGAVLAIAALAGLSRATAPPQPRFVAMAVAEARADADRTVYLTLDFRNAVPEDLRGTLRVATRAGEEETVTTRELSAGADGGGRVVLDVPGACGNRITVTAEAPGVTREVAVRVPCPPGAEDPP